MRHSAGTWSGKTSEVPSMLNIVIKARMSKGLRYYSGLNYSLTGQNWE